MIHIEAKAAPPIEHELVERAASLVLRHEAAPSAADLTVVLTDDEQLRELNREYLGHDEPTDVLSFPASEPDPETGVHYLGDVLISMPRAAEQALAAGHPLESEVQLLVVHGTLHLLGHDHAETADRARMWAAQAAVLDQLGLAAIKIHE